MEKVTGIGGVFIKSDDPVLLQEWYRRHLGIEPEWETGSSFTWRDKDDPERVGMTIWSLMPRSSQYFDPSSAPFMINYRVIDLHKMLAQLRAAGLDVDDKIEESEYGRFGWVMDPEGNRVELWEPPA